MYDRILLPTDGDPGTERAVEHALDLARQYGADLHVLYVVDDAALVPENAAVVVEALEEEGRRTVEEVVDHAEESGVTASGTVQHGRPHRTILDYADANDVDLVVMGTHGRRGLDRYLLGSVAERVVRLSTVPVLTVRMLDEEDEAPAREAEEGAEDRESGPD